MIVNNYRALRFMREEMGETLTLGCDLGSASHCH